MATAAPDKATAITATVGESQADAAYRLLRNWVTTCRLKPGASVHLGDILKQTNLGRTPAREAFLRLEKDGLIETMPRSGYRIKPLTHETISDFFTVWKKIAPLIFRLASERMTEDDLKALRVLIAPLDSPSLTPAEHCKVRSDLFRAMTDRIGNAYLTRTCNQLKAEMERIFFLFFTYNADEEWLESVDLVIEILTDADKARIERRVERYIRLAERAIVESLREMPVAAVRVPRAKSATAKT